MSPPPLLTATGISKAFGRKVVLDQVSFVASPGECVGLVGENGSGKSTLLRICAGLLTADAGRLNVGGSIGYCPQEPGLFDLLTADEHLVVFGRARNLSRRAAMQRGRAVLAGIGFPVGDRSVSRDLSGGARQKLNLALAILADPNIVLLDEPYQGFDHGSYVNFWADVDRWKQDGCAVVVVTHLLAESSRVDRLVELAGPTPAGQTMTAVSRIGAIAEAHGRDLSRRRGALVLLTLLPLAFYAALAGHSDHAVATATVAFAFSGGGSAIFSSLAAGQVDRRLVLGGYRPVDLLAGRLTVLLVTAVPIAVAAAAIMTAISHPSRPADLFGAVVLTAIIAVPFGLAVGALMSRDLEATLVLIGVVGVQLVVEPNSTLSRLLPFGQARRLALASVDGSVHTVSVILLSLAYATALFAVAAIINHLRLHNIRSRPDVGGRT